MYSGGSRGRGRSRSGFSGSFGQTMARVFLFPALLLYLEVVFHCT